MISGKPFLLRIFYVLFGILFITSCHSTATTPIGKKGTPPLTHEAWDTLLKKHVDENGWVDYEGFIKNQEELEAYLETLSSSPPATDWPEEAKLAYWINAYNAFTVKLIVDNYPLKSIRELHTLPFVATIWHEDFFQIGGQPASLDQIEHSILRKEFYEPRIHFAINCASVSCPVLRNEAYEADKLERQLTDQAKRFLASPIRNNITVDKVELSRIFQWFKGDFTKEGSLIEFLNQYAPVKIHSDAEVSYLDYDWGLNVEKH